LLFETARGLRFIVEKKSSGGKSRIVRSTTKTLQAKQETAPAAVSQSLTLSERVAQMRKHGIGSIQITAAKTMSELKIGRIFPEAVEND